MQADRCSSADLNQNEGGVVWPQLDFDAVDFVGRQKKVKNSCVQSYDFLVSILSRSENGRFSAFFARKGFK